jgi:hypothetical protein
LSAIAHACLVDNDIDAAYQHTADAVALVAKNGDGTFAPLAYKTHAEVLARKGLDAQAAQTQKLAALHIKRSGAVVWDEIYDKIQRNRG